MDRARFIEEKKIMGIESRTGLAKMVLRLFDLWNISATDQALVLRVYLQSYKSRYEYTQGTP